jgi:hypothetical protein
MPPIDPKIEFTIVLQAALKIRQTSFHIFGMMENSEAQNDVIPICPMERLHEIPFAKTEISQLMVLHRGKSLFQ